MRQGNLLAIVAIFALSARAGAQTTQSDKTDPPETQKTEATADDGGAEADVLAGPAVVEQADDRTAPLFASSNRRDGRPLDVGVWRRMLRRLDLDEEQRESIAAVVVEYQRANRQHQRANGERIGELRRLIREAGESDRRDAAAENEERRAELAKLVALAPDARAYQIRSWELLNAQQQEQMRAQIHELREQAMQRRLESGMDPEIQEMMEKPPAPRRDAPMREARRVTDRAPAPVGLDDLARHRFEFLQSKRSRPVQ